MAKSATERQKEYRANRKQLNCFISELAFQSLTDIADSQGKTKIEALETMLIGNNSLIGNNADIERLTTENARLSAINAQLEKDLQRARRTNSNLRAGDKALVKRNDDLFADNERFKGQLKVIERYLKTIHNDDMSEILNEFYRGDL